MNDVKKPLSPIFNYAYGIYKALQGRNDAELIAAYGEKDWQISQPQLDALPNRFVEAMAMQKSFSNSLFHWIFNSREDTNYTFPIRPINIDYMAAFVANIANIPLIQARTYIDELLQDQTIPTLVQQWVAANPNNTTTDTEVRYGKRLTWYALARALKPRTILETGIDKGLGSAVMCLALLKNKQESNGEIAGRYYGLDISPHTGVFLQAPFTEVGKILLGDSIESLKKFHEPIDFLICDSDHTPGYEMREYQTAEAKFSPNACIVSDTAIYDPALFEYAKGTGRNFLYCPEYSDNHWYPGDGIGVAWRPLATSR